MFKKRPTSCSGNTLSVPSCRFTLSLQELNRAQQCTASLPTNHWGLWLWSSIHFNLRIYPLVLPNWLILLGSALHFLWIVSVPFNNPLSRIWHFSPGTQKIKTTQNAAWDRAHSNSTSCSRYRDAFPKRLRTAPCSGVCYTPTRWRQKNACTDTYGCRHTTPSRSKAVCSRARRRRAAAGTACRSLETARKFN